MIDVETMLKEQKGVQPIPLQTPTKSEIFKYCGAFSNQKIYATREELTKLLGKPTNVGDEKVNYSFFVKKDGLVYEIYDYKEPKNTSVDETIGWHIGFDYKKAKHNTQGAVNLWHDLRLNLSILRTQEQLN